MKSDPEFLNLFGWTDFFANQMKIEDLPECVPARVICEERNLYRVQWGLEQSGWASISGKMQYQAKTRVDYPAVGDWVLIGGQEGSDRATIHHIGPRKSTIYRKQIGSSSDAQILSTNVDYTFITTSINEDLNHRRIERYLAMAMDSGTSPIILLTKADLYPDDLEAIEADMAVTFPGVPVYFLSKNEFEKAEFFRNYIKQGKTSVIVGSSGVGKSTIVNYLIGKDQVKTQEIRETDGKGRHTTTSRNLYVSRFGGLIIDTPGMRELSLSDHADGVENQFQDIVDLFESCRFSDCKHKTEPGCAVKAALADQSLDQDRWESYLKLEAEVRHNVRKQDKSVAAEDKRKWKKLNVEARERSQSKRGK